VCLRVFQDLKLEGRTPLPDHVIVHTRDIKHLLYIFLSIDDSIDLDLDDSRRLPNDMDIVRF
jgi:hypothetical protein